MSNTADEREEFFEIALTSLNEGPKKAFIESFPTLRSLSEEQIKQAQLAFVNKYNSQEPFFNYQLYYSRIEDFEDLCRKALALNLRQAMFLQPSLIDESIFCSREGPYLCFSFCRFERKEDRDAAGNQVRYNVFFGYRVRCEWEDGLLICTMQFPRLKLHPYQPYPYTAETRRLENWFSQSFDVDLEGVDLKAFFEELKSPEFDKAGFEVSDIQREDDEIVAADFKIQLPRMSEKTSHDMYSAMDSIIAPELADDLRASIFLRMKSREIAYPPELESAFEEIFAELPISRRFFNTLHTACLYGIGHVRYRRAADSILIRCSLEYMENRRGLMRLSHMKWSSFEPIFGEIRKFIKRISR